MGDVLVLGGGICGLGTAMMLARDGHEVTVIERDPQSPPASIEEAWRAWERPGVNQWRQAHYMHARFRHVLDENLPDVRDALVDAGGLRFDPLAAMFPPTIEDREPRPNDDQYQTLTGRRPVLETVFAQKAEDEPGVKILRGTQVTGLIGGTEASNGVPHIVGATTAGGDELRADVVIDAMGRKSQISEWVPALGGRAPIEEAEDCGFTYYGRYFRSRDGKLPQAMGPLLAELGTFSVLTLPGDNDTWMVVVWVSSADQPLKQLRFEEKWQKVMRAVPLQAHWLDGEPVGDFEVMAGIMDRRRRFVVDDVPIATGLLPVADAWACTNPSLGRGVSLGLWHAARLRDHLRSSNGDPTGVAREWDTITEAEFTPWYQAQVQMDRARLADLDALREGREPRPPAAVDMPGQMMKAFMTALAYDADVFRAFIEVMSCLSTPEEILARPGMFEKVIAGAEGREPIALPAPTREELLELIS